MPRDIVWSDEAVGDLRRLDRQIAQRIRNAVRRLAETGHGDVKRLQGVENEWRLRVGDWRVRFTFDYAANKIYVLHVRPRGSAYRD